MASLYYSPLENTVCLCLVTAGVVSLLVMAGRIWRLQVLHNSRLTAKPPQLLSISTTFRRRALPSVTKTHRLLEAVKSSMSRHKDGAFDTWKAHKKNPFSGCHTMHYNWLEGEPLEVLTEEDEESAEFEDVSPPAMPWTPMYTESSSSSLPCSLP